eukprot:1158848-Pelagomonas_calceolata.AAC.10
MSQACSCLCVEQLRAAGYMRLANEVELAKASKFLGNKEFESAIAVFKAFLADGFERVLCLRSVV